MVDTQIIFRVDKELLTDLDKELSRHGFKTRNEWFRSKVREFVEEAKNRR